MERAKLVDLIRGGEIVSRADLGGEDLSFAELSGAILENVRFAEGETSNDPELARALADLADAYVGDAFGAVHRAHASTEGVAHLLPHAAGRLLERELSQYRRGRRQRQSAKREPDSGA